MSRESQNILNSCIILVKFVPFPTYTVLSKGDSNTATIHDSNKKIVMEWSLRTYIFRIPICQENSFLLQINCKSKLHSSQLIYSL